MFQPPKGTRDLSPSEMRKLQFVIDKIRLIFEKYGFQPLETPAFESYELLAAKSGDIKNEIYYFKDKAERELGLRFEFTASLARFISNNPNISKPFKRYQIGKVWRYENPQAMRFREFWQADIDIIGTDSVLADAECLACFVECMQALGFKDFFIRINSRKILEDALISFVPKDKILDVFRSIDKIDKIGIKDVKKELDEKGFDSDKILSIFKSKKEPTGEVKELLSFAKQLGIDKKLRFDFSLVRGLDYYTGLVFELFAGEKISCGGGGRYDNLIKDLGGPDLPATGISFGLDRIVSLMEKKKLFKEEKEKELFVAPVNDSVRKDALKICQTLRKKGIISETDLMNRKLSKQLEYASTFPYVAIVGPTELKKNSVKLRDMSTGKEKLVKISELAKEIKP